MISAGDPDNAAAFDALLVLMEQQAAAIAEASVQSAQMARTQNDRRWRTPELLWPSFMRGY